jgi:hypothetical protein
MARRSWVRQRCSEIKTAFDRFRTVAAKFNILRTRRCNCIQSSEILDILTVLCLRIRSSLLHAENVT